MDDVEPIALVIGEDAGVVGLSGIDGGSSSMRWMQLDATVEQSFGVKRESRSPRTSRNLLNFLCGQRTPI